MKKFIASLIMFSLLVTLVLAAPVSKTIRAIFNTAQFKLGSKTANIETVTYNNKVYVPLNDIAKLLNQRITFNAKLNIYELTSLSETPKQITAEELVKALQKAGLPIIKIQVYTAENDPNKLLGRPYQYISKVNFIDSRIKKEMMDSNINVSNGGSIEVFANADDAKQRYEYLTSIAKSSSLFAEYDYLIRNVILRLSKELTPSQAGEYKEKLAEIVE